MSEHVSARPVVDLLYAATSSHVVALDPATGQELWRRKLPKGGGIMTMLLKGDDLYVAGSGYVYCLDRYLGEVRWRNDMKKLGWSLITLAMEGASGTGDAGVIAAQQQAQASQNAAMAG